MKAEDIIARPTKQSIDLNLGLKRPTVNHHLVQLLKLSLLIKQMELKYLFSVSLNAWTERRT